MKRLPKFSEQLNEQGVNESAQVDRAIKNTFDVIGKAIEKAIADLENSVDTDLSNILKDSKLQAEYGSIFDKAAYIYKSRYDKSAVMLEKLERLQQTLVSYKNTVDKDKDRAAARFANRYNSLVQTVEDLNIPSILSTTSELEWDLVNDRAFGLNLRTYCDVRDEDTDSIYKLVDHFEANGIKLGIRGNYMDHRTVERERGITAYIDANEFGTGVVRMTIIVYYPN
jgi:hypothetical protein